MAIEVDGVTHSDKFVEDKIRQAELERLGMSFLRFYDDEVLNNIEGVIMAIDNWIDTHPVSPRH